MRNIFKSLNLNIRMITKNENTIRTYLKNDLFKTQQKCKKRNCLISNNKLCFKNNVVYQITCTTCNKIYIGSTIQYWHERITQHHSDTRSGIFYHKDNDGHNNFTYKIVAQCQDEVKLRLTEAILIHRHEPKLNRKHELVESLSYLNL